MEKQFNMQFVDVFEALDYLMEEKKIEVEQKERPRIGFKQEAQNQNILSALHLKWNKFQRSRSSLLILFCKVLY
jgi:hypothetical protein